MRQFRRLVLAVLFVAAMARFAVAEASTLPGTPPTTPPASPITASPPAPPQIHDIAVFGDSLGDGVWAGLYEEMKTEPQDRLYRDTKVGTGLTRPDYENFVQGFIASLAADHVTDAVVMFGANDDEGLRDSSHKSHTFGTPDWQAAYAARMQEIISACQADKIRVFWLGLPVLRDPQRNRDALAVNVLLQQTVTQNDAVFIPLEDDFKGDKGGFALYLPDTKGDLRQLRAPDGTHFTFSGYDLIARKVLAAILAPPVPPAAAQPIPAPAAPTATVPPAGALPKPQAGAP